MLVIFCGALMVAFLIPQAVSQFAPNPAKAVLATIYDGEELVREDITRVSGDVQMLRRLRIEPPEFAAFGLTLIPQTGSERNDALAWMMIQRAAERNGLGASRNEAFNLIASVLGMEDFDSLDEEAKEFGANANYLIELGRQYLVAEQYRQLVSGIEYNLPDEDDDSVGSPGTRRVIAMNEAIQRIQQELQQFGPMMQQNPQLAQQLQLMTIENVLVNQGYLDRIQGHERFSATELRYALQRENAEIDLTVVVLDAEDRLASTTIDDAYVQKIFEQFADDEPGTGQPYGIGYREPDKVQLEAIRIPIDQVRDQVAKTITPEDVRRFYNDNPSAFIDMTPPAEGEEPSFAPQKLTAELRDQIRLTLTQLGAEEKVVEIAQKARQRLNEDARGLPDSGVYKELPEDFKPTPLTEVAAEIESEHGITPEIIIVDEFVSSEDIVESARFTQAWVSKMPTAEIKLPDQRFGQMVDVPVPQTVLAGPAGLFIATVPTLSQELQQVFRLADYLTVARSFLTEEQREQIRFPLQAGLPGQYLRDGTGSSYVFRITEVQPSRPATDLTPIAEAVREDAKRIKAYENLIDDKESLLSTAASQSIERLMPDADAKNTLSGLTRGSIGQQQFGMTIDGVTSTQPILERAFQITDDLIASGGFDQASESDLIFAVELAGDYKLAIVRIDTFRPMTRAAFEEEATKPASLMLATNLGATEPLQPPLSFEALQRYTGFEWAEGYGDDEDDEAEADDEEADQE
jgi:hypothetical protein